MEYKLNLKEVNDLSCKQFHLLFENVVECWPEAAVFVSALAPFPKVDDILRAFDNYLERLNVESKVKIFKQHPRLTTGIFLGEDPLSTDIEIKKKTEDFESKFGYPFIVCVRDYNPLEILQSLNERINNDEETEINNQINEVKKICKLRILEIVENY